MRFSTLLFSAFAIFLGTATISAQTWTPQQTSTDGGIRDISFLDERIGVGAVWILPGSAAIVRTSDGGASWTTAYSDINEGMTGAAFPSLNSPVVVGGTFNFGRIYTSGNQGASWNRTVETAAVQPSFWALDFPSAAVGYAGGGNRTLFSTTDGGANWKEENRPVGSGGGQVVGLHFLTDEVGWAITTGSDQDNTNGEELWRTTDGGGTWQIAGEFFVARAVHFIDEARGYVAGYDGAGPTVWRTLDSGRSWSPTRLTPSSQNYLHDVVFDTENPYVGYAVGGNLFDQDEGIIARTTDGGASWVVEEEDLPVVLFAVDMPQQRTVYASGSSGVVYKTTRTTIFRPEPTAETSVASIDFDTLRVGETDARQIVLRSTTAAGLRVDSIYLSDTGAAAQGITLTTSAPTTLLGVDSLFITLRAQPTDTVPIFGMLHILTNDAARPVIDIPYTGVVLPEEQNVEPVAQLSSTGIDFDSVLVGDSSSATFTITSGSSAPLDVTSITLDPALSDFMLTTSESLPATLLQQEKIEVMVTFLPTEVGTRSGGVQLRTNDPTNQILEISLTGIGTVEEDTTTMSVQRPTYGSGLRVAPNPARERIGVVYETKVPAVLQCRLYSVAGALITTSGPAFVEKGMHSTDLSTAGLTPGLYVVEIVADGRLVARRKVAVLGR